MTAYEESANLPVDPAAMDPEPAAPWEVTFRGGFWGSDGKPGQEIPIGKHFLWGSESWYIPAAYLCDEGLVLDFCLEADPEEMNAFIQKWDLLHEERHSYTAEQRKQMALEHPLCASFCGKVTCNGEPLENGHGCGVTWLPASCVPHGIPEDPAGEILTHYGLDAAKAWSFQRQSYPWGKSASQDLHDLHLRMERLEEQIPGQHFATPAVGESLSLTHPRTGEVYTLTVHETQHQELPERLFPDTDLEHPRHLLSLSYSLEPDITDRGFLILDCSDGDKPRPKAHSAAGNSAFAAAIGVIGGADGPTAVIVGGHAPKLHAACSSLYFEAAEDVQWRAVFSEKLLEDIEICLI